MTKLIDKITLSTFTTGYGIFTNIQTNHSADFTWLTSSVAHTLDIDYYLNHSGDKIISPYYENLEKLVEAQESGNVLTLLGDSISLRFKDSWNKLYSALSDNYDPVEDFNITETRTPNITHTLTNNLTEETLTKTNSDYTTTTDSTQAGSVYGFNSSSAVPSQNVDNDGTVSVQGDAEDNYVDSEKNNTGTQTNAETGTETKAKHGINTRTAQELIAQEIELRKKQFYEMIMNDVDTIMICNVYYND